MHRNHLPSAITCHNGVVRVDLDVFNGYKQVELCRNHKLVLICPLTDDDNQQLPALTLEQLKALKDTFLEYLEINKNLKISKKDYESRIGLLIKWLEESNIHLVSPEHWRDYYTHLKNRLNQKDLSATTVRNYFRNLNNFAVWLVEKGHLPSNPLEGIKPPQPPQTTIRSKAISVEDIDIMLEQAKAVRDRAIFVFFRDTACRGTEAVTLVWENIDWERGQAQVIGKWGKLRTLLFKPVTAQILKEYRKTLKEPQKTGAVWWGKQGPLTYSGLYQIFARTAKRASLQNKKFNPHAWRHAFGRDATKNGMPTGLLQKVLGHESIETTQIYIDSDEETIRQAHHQYSPIDNLQIDLDANS